MDIQAAVVSGAGSPYQIQDLKLKTLADDDILVKIVASGICQTDVYGRHAMGALCPIVLGHEGAGIVEEVGSHVKEIEVGDHVVMSFPYCGHCFKCEMGKPGSCPSARGFIFGGRNMHGEYVFQSEAGEDVSNFFNQSSFATYSIANENNVIKVDKSYDLRYLAPLGCGLITGAGAVLGDLKPEPTSTFAVFGTGGLGFAGLFSAKAHGAKTIIAIDRHQHRLDLAKELGADYIINVNDFDDLAKELPQAILDYTGGQGVDYAVDTTGDAEIIPLAMYSLATEGHLVLQGIPTEHVSIDSAFLLQNRTISGNYMGHVPPKVYIPYLAELYQQGRFPIDKIVKFYDFEEINQAEADSSSGDVIKPVLVMDKDYKV